MFFVVLADALTRLELTTFAWKGTGTTIPFNIHLFEALLLRSKSLQCLCIEYVLTSFRNRQP